MKWLLFLLSLIGCIGCDGNGSNSLPRLESKGYNYLANHMMSPSSVILLKCISAKDTEKMFKEVNWKFEPYQQAVYYDIEASNAMGGMLKKSYVVFFVDGNPMDFLEANRISKSNVSTLKNILRVNGFYKNK